MSRVADGVKFATWGDSAVAKDPVGLWDWLHGACDRYGVAHDLTIICGSSSPAQAICLVRMGNRAEAEAAASALGGVLFGASEALFELGLPDEFTCAKRQAGHELRATCVCHSPVFGGWARQIPPAA